MLIHDAETKMPLYSADSLHHPQKANQRLDDMMHKESKAMMLRVCVRE